MSDQDHCICKADHDDCTVAPGQEHPNYSLRDLGGEEEKPYGGADEDGEGVHDVQGEGGGGLLEDSNENPTVYAEEPTEKPEIPEGEADQHMESKTDQSTGAGAMGENDDGDKYKEEAGGHRKQFHKEEFGSELKCVSC